MIILCLLPALFANIYAVVTQWHRRSFINVFLLIVGGLIALSSAAVMYVFLMGIQMPSFTLRIVQQVVSCQIVPIAYMFFAAQMGRNWFNGTTITLWALMLLLLMPSGLFSLDLTLPLLAESVVEPMSMHFFIDGDLVFEMRNADVVIMLQGAVTLTRLYVLGRMVHNYHLALSPHMRYFGIWWLACIAFIVFTSFHSTKEISQPPLIYIYYVSFSALITVIFVLISLNFDLRFIMAPDDGNSNEGDEEESFVEDDAQAKVVENMDAFFVQSSLMADRVRYMMNEEKRYLDISFTADTAIRELGTNRTYFYRMIKAEFACTFADLLQGYRMKHAATLLTTTNLPIQDIAEACGFTDRTSFSRRFRQVYDLSPSQYRGTGGG